MNGRMLLGLGATLLLWGCGWLPDEKEFLKLQDEVRTGLFLAQAQINEALIYATANYQAEFVPGQIIVAYHQEGPKPPMVSSLSRAVGADSQRILMILPGETTSARSAQGDGRVIALVTLTDRSRQGVLDAIESLRGSAGVAYVEPDYLVSAGAIPPDDPLYGQLWGLTRIRAQEAWALSTGSPTVVVAVVDSGINYKHLDLEANVWKNPGEIAGNGVDDDGNGYVDDVLGWNFFSNNNDPMDDMAIDNTYHGTHVAGIIAAAGDNAIGVTGVTWSTKVAALKFLNATGTGPSSNAILAINYATKMRFPIVNASWGGAPYTQALYDAISNAGNQGILVVVAAGNTARDNDTNPFYPSSYDSPNLISVAASDASDQLADFSQWGRVTVDLAAPGVNILSTSTGNGYHYLSGTSMATPQVSGAAALLKARHPSQTALQLKADILSSVDVVAALNNRTVTGGRLNLAKLLNTVGTLPAGAFQTLAPNQIRPGDTLFLVSVVSGLWLASSPATSDAVLSESAELASQATSWLVVEGPSFGALRLRSQTTVAGPLVLLVDGSGARLANVASSASLLTLASIAGFPGSMVLMGPTSAARGISGRTLALVPTSEPEARWLVYKGPGSSPNL